MTSINFNRIMRANLNIKTTSQLVSTCIDKLYQHSQQHFRRNYGSWLDALPTKAVPEKKENKAPIRTLKAQERLKQPATIFPRNKNRLSTLSGGGQMLLNSVMFRSKKSNSPSVTSSRKSPNYKIYNNRRIGSSASSSNASIFRRYDDRYRYGYGLAASLALANNTRSGIAPGVALRNFATQQRGSKTSYGIDLSTSKYMVPLRNQQIEGSLGSVPNAIEVSSAIQRDLMLVDTTVKNRISLGKNRIEKITPESKAKSDPMSGWHHPPSTSLFTDLNTERNKERMVANAELQAQYRRLKSASRERQFENLRLMEKRATLLGSAKSPPTTRLSETMIGSPALPPAKSSRPSRPSVSAIFVSGGEPLEKVQRRTHAERSATRRAPNQTVHGDTKRATSTDLRGGGIVAPLSLPIQKIQIQKPPKGPKVPPPHTARLSTESKLPVQEPVSRASKPAGPTATSLMAAQAKQPVLVGNQTSRFNRTSYIAPSKKY